jgi:hypothetical protein
LRTSPTTRKGDLEQTLDYNDGLVRNGVRGVKMNLFCICANHDPNSYDPSTRCGIYMSGTLWNRNGVEPEKTRSWYCGLERTEWEHIVQKQCLPEAGACKNNKPFDTDLALNEVPKEVGCGCRFGPFKEVASMVLEVSDKSVPGTCTQYAIRASIPPEPPSAEIQKVQRGWFNAGKATSAKELYKNIPMIHPKIHLIPGLPIPPVGRLPIVQAITEDWPEINDERWYKMAMTIATQHKQQLHRIYALRNQRLGTNPAGPANHAATHIRSPLQQAPWPEPPYSRDNPPPPPQQLPRPTQAPQYTRDNPPPPPPHPPPPMYSVMTQRGARGFEPDAVITLRYDEDVIHES